MNINDMEEFVTGMTSSDLDLLAKMAREELEQRAKNKKRKPGIMFVRLSESIRS